MTSFQMDAMLKSIRLKREGCKLLISGRAIIDGKLAGFMITRKIPSEQKPRVPPIKLLWFDELGDFNKKGEAR